MSDFIVVQPDPTTCMTDPDTECAEVADSCCFRIETVDWNSDYDDGAWKSMWALARNMPEDNTPENPQNPIAGAQLDFCMPKDLYASPQGTWGYDFVTKTTELQEGKTMEDYVTFMQSTIDAQKNHKLFVGCVSDWDTAKVTEWKDSDETWKEGATKIALTGLAAIAAVSAMF